LSIEKIKSDLCSRNVQIERAVICQILIDGYVDPDVKAVYFQGAEEKLFNEIDAMWQLNGEIDVPLIKTNHRELVDLILDGDNTNTKSAITALRDEWMRRETARAVLKAYEEQNPVELARRLQSNLSEILVSKTNKEYNHTESIRTCMSLIEDGCKADRGVIGVPIGIKPFDFVVQGFEKKKVYVIGALKKTGKSRFMMFAALKLCEAGKKVLINSLEMSDAQLNLLAISYYSGINSSRLGGSKIQDHELERSVGSYSKAHELGWSINRDYTIPELKSRILHMKQTTGVDYVFVDFIQRMREERYKSDRVREVEAISQGLADISRDCDVGVIELAQLAGYAEKLEGDQIPNMSHLKESQGIAENADTIIIMHNPLRHEQQSGNYVPPIFKFKVEQRYGISGAVVDVEGDLRTCNFIQPTQHI